MLEIIKNSTHNGILTIKPIEYNVAKKMMLENHYSKKWNHGFGKFNFGIYRDGELLGASVFGNLMNSKSYYNISKFGPNSVIELNRMWIDDKLGKNSETILISSSIKLLKQLNPEIKYIQSFADGRLGCGTIYKASNFNYCGYSKSLFFQDNITNEVFHKVPLECTNRPKGFLVKNKAWLEGRLQAFYVKTYRYIYIIDKKNPCLLKEEQYPKYEKGSEVVDEYKPALGLLCRLLIMYNIIEEFELCDLVKEKIEELGYMERDMEEELIHQEENESIIWFKSKYIRNKNNVSKLKKLINS